MVYSKYLGEVTNDVSGKVAGIKTSAKVGQDEHLQLVRAHKL